MKLRFPAPKKMLDFADARLGKGRDESGAHLAVGPAHALAARRGKRVVVLDRDAQANGASGLRVRPPGGSRRRVSRRRFSPTAGRLMLVDRPGAASPIIVITSGTGASASFAIAEETMAELFG